MVDDLRFMLLRAHLLKLWDQVLPDCGEDGGSDTMNCFGLLHCSLHSDSAVLCNIHFGEFCEKNVCCIMVNDKALHFGLHIHDFTCLQ